MPTVYTEVEVDVSLEDFDYNDLIEELERRGHGFGFESDPAIEIVTKIYELRRNGRDYQRELDDLIYVAIGKIL